MAHSDFNKNREKIRKNWLLTQQNQSSIDSINQQGAVTKTNIDLSKSNLIDTGWTLGTSFEYELHLNNFTDLMLNNLKIIPIVKSFEGYRNEDYLDNFYITKDIKKINTNIYILKISIEIVLTSEFSNIPIYTRMLIAVDNRRTYAI